MALTVDDLRLNCNIIGTVDDAVLGRLLTAAQKHIERLLGYALSDTDELPDGAPADLEEAVYLLAAHWYECREASIVGVSAQSIPFGVAEIIAEHRNYTFGLADE